MKFKLSALILALLASSVTLWLIESPLKYAFYFFEASLILILLYSLSGKLRKIKVETNKNIVTKFDYAFLTTSTLLLIFNILKLDNVLTLLCAITVSFFLPGYVLLRLLKFHSLESWIEWLALSFALSIGVTSIIFTTMLPFAAGRAVPLSAIYVGMSLCPLLKDWIYKPGEKPQVRLENRVKEYDLADVLLLLWITVFFVFAISSLYPQMSFRPGLDIVRHFSSSRLLALAPDAYSSNYLWFHASWANIYELSSPPMEMFQTGLAYLSVMVIFAFYVMSKAYLKDVDKRAPILATVTFSVFAGFGWLYFLTEKLNMSDSRMQLDLLGVSGDISYMDIGYGQGSWLWFWLRPMTIAFATFFILLYLLNRKDISKRRYVVIFSSLTITLGFIHIPELILFNVFLLVLVILRPQVPNLRLKEASLATLIGCISYFLYSFVSKMFIGIVKIPPMSSLLILIGTATASYILAHKFNWQGIKTSLFSLEMRGIKLLIFIIALIFMAGLLTWFSSPNLFSVHYVSETYYIPLMLYPVMLGIVGFFALHGLIVIVKEYRNYLAVVCVILFLFVLVFGKFISLINVEFIDLGYGEKRFFPVIFAAVSILASVSILNQVSGLIHERKKVLSVIAVILIVITGITSTTLSIEYWDRPCSVSYYTLDAAEYLSSPVNRDIRTPILTASSATRSLAGYIPSPYVVDAYRHPIWESLYPETPLLILYNKFYPPPYLYLDYRDFDYILSRYGDSYFNRHLFRLLPEAYSNPEVTVFRVPEGVPPSLNSNVTLIIPDDNRTDYLSAYHMLSLGGYDHTVCLSSDTKTIIDKETIIIPCDDEDYSKLLENLEFDEEFKQKHKKIIIFNFNGYGPLADLFFELKTENVKATHLNGFNFALDLPIKVNVPSLLENNNVNTLAWYSDGKEKTPFAAELTKDDISLFYINVYPIIRASLKEEILSDSRQVLNLLMDEIIAGKVKDVSMSGNDGSVYETKIVYSPFGMALDFDGNESFIEVLHSDELNLTKKVTIETWIKPKDPDSGFTIISKKAGFSSLNGYVFLFDGGAFYFNFGNRTNYFSNAFSYGRLKADQWYHLVVSYDGRYVTYYVNGAEVGSVEQSEIIASNNLNLLIGKRHDDAWKLDGSIYKVVIYDDALTSSEIRESYNRTIAKSWSRNPMSPILGDLMKITGLDFPAHVDYEDWIFEGNTAFFRNSLLCGNVNIKSPSFTDFTINEMVKMTLVTDLEQIEVSNIETLYISETNYTEINAQQAEIHEGKSFYTKITLNNPTLSLTGENALITLVTSDEKNKEITFQNGELTISGQLTLHARTPTIHVNGKANFREMYSLFSLHPSLRSLGQDLNITGTVEFQLPVSDTYTFASDFKWNGSVVREPPILTWNEYDSIKNMLPWLIVSIILVAIWRTFLFQKNSIPQQD